MTAPPVRQRVAADTPEAVALAAIDRPVAMFASALAGQALRLELAAPAGRAQAGTITLSPALLAGGSGQRSWGAMRIEVLRHVVGLQPGGRWRFDAGVAEARGLVGPRTLPAGECALQRCIASWPRPVLLRRLFRIIEGGRVDARLEQQFPGAVADLQACRRHALARMGRSDRPLRALLQGLQHQALGVTQAGPELATAAAAMQGSATVYDSLQAAIGIAASLCRASRRHADIAQPRRLRIETSPTAPGQAVPGRGAADLPLDPASGEVALAALRTLRRDGSDEPVPTPAAPGSGRGPAQDHDAVQGARSGDAPARPTVRAEVFRHDEWHYLEQRYLKAWTHVHELRLRGDDLQYLAQLRQRHAGLVAVIRRRIGKVRPEGRERLHRLRDGDRIDVDAAIAARVERRAGHPGDDRVYAAVQPARRDVCAAFLLDVSGSTGFLVPDASAKAAVDATPADDDPYFYASPRHIQALPAPRRRVIDVAKDAIGLMCDALHRLGDRHAVYGFSGEGRHRVEFHVAKGFDEAWSMHSAAALARMEPKGSTRTGAALRHAARKLAGQPERARLLIVVTDGYPQDGDYGPAPDDIEYGLRDTAQAMREAERAGIEVFCVSVDHAAHDYLRRLCPASRYLVIDEVGALPEQLSKVYRKLTRHGAR
jgi:hypothetical protein